MSENEQTDMVTVTDMSPVDQLIKFCLDNNIQRTVIEELIERGFDSLTALSLIDGEASMVRMLKVKRFLSVNVVWFCTLQSH